MSKEQIIDEVYGKYADSHEYFVDGWMHVIPMFHNKETFVNECKTNPKFSETWGLKIEERELSEIERMEIGISQGMWKEFQFGNIHQPCDEKNIPTKLITLTYNNEKIKSYE